MTSARGVATVDATVAEKLANVEVGAGHAMEPERDIMVQEKDRPWGRTLASQGGAC